MGCKVKIENGLSHISTKENKWYRVIIRYLENCTISIGVPQGSVLGPLLFLIYVNDINRHVHLGACNLYADDTLVYCNGSTMSELKHNIQQCVSDIHEWYDQNKLVINKSKSSVMLATARQRILHIDNNDLDVHIGDYKLVQSDCIDYLGVKIDETISWNKQTDNICKKSGLYNL